MGTQGAADEVRISTKTTWDNDELESPADREADTVWHGKLMVLLGRLEFGRASLENPAHLKAPTTAVRVAAAIVNDVAGFIEKHVDPTRYARPIADSLAAAGRFLTAAQVAIDAPAPKRKFLGLIPIGAAPAARVDECLWVLRDLSLVLERYFTMLGSCFCNQSKAMEWVDTSGVYLAELRRALSWSEVSSRE